MENGRVNFNNKILDGYLNILIILLIECMFLFWGKWVIE